MRRRSRKRIRPHLGRSDGSWRVDETYIRVKGRWMYLYRAVDGRGATIDFLLSAARDAAAAKRFFRKALGRPYTANPRTITVDKNPAYPRAVAEMKRGGELWRFSRLRQSKFLNNIVEQDHRRVKCLVRPGQRSPTSTPSWPSVAAASTQPRSGRTPPSIGGPSRSSRADHPEFV